MNKVRILLGAVLFGTATALSALEGMLVPTLSVNLYDQVTGLLPQRPVHLTLCRQLAPGQRCSLYFTVKNPAVKEGKVAVSGTLVATDVHGKKKNIFQDRTLFANSVQGTPLILTSPISLTMYFQSDDQPGKYTWDLTLKDLNSGETCQVPQVSIELQRSPSDSMPMTEKEWERFLSGYYLNPAPQRTMAALDYFFTVKDAEYKKKVKNYNPLILLSGFARLFRLNPQLWPLLSQYGKTLTKEQCKYLALIVNGIGSDAVDAMRSDLPEEAQKMIASFNHRNPLYAGNPTKLCHLDMLWMEFCITGCKAPIVKILNELRKREIMTLEEVKAKADKKEKLTPAEQKKFLNFIMSLSAYKLISSAQQRGHRLPGYYIEAMLARKELDPVVASLTAKALQNATKKTKKTNNNNTTK